MKDVRTLVDSGSRKDGLAKLALAELDEPSRKKTHLREAVKKLETSANLLELSDKAPRYGQVHKYLGDARATLASLEDERANLLKAQREYEAARQQYTEAEFPRQFGEIGRALEIIQRRLDEIEGK